MHVVVSEMTNRDMLRENMAASRDHTLHARDQRLLEDHRIATAHLYCHGCGQLCEPAAGGVAVADDPSFPSLLRSLRQAPAARELYQALPPDARQLVEADLAAAEAACPHGLPSPTCFAEPTERMG